MPFKRRYDVPQPDVRLPSELARYPAPQLARRLRALERLRTAALAELEAILDLPECIQTEAVWAGAFDVERRFQLERREWLRRCLPDGAWKEQSHVAA